jgi:hypothetical protein
MTESKIKELFELAEEDLNHARQELYRPSTDVVSFSACVSTRRALYRYLEALANTYAAKNNDSFAEDGTIETLIDFCSKYNDQIKQIDFSSLNCKCNDIMEDGEEEIVYCTNVEKVNYCTELAEKVRSIIKEEI